MSFSMIESMLRFGRKYAFHYLWDIAMDCLRADLPQSLDLALFHQKFAHSFQIPVPLLRFQNFKIPTLRMLSFEVEESESSGRILLFQHFVRQTRPFAAKGYFFFWKNKDRNPGSKGLPSLKLLHLRGLRLQSGQARETRLGSITTTLICTSGNIVMITQAGSKVSEIKL